MDYDRIRQQYLLENKSQRQIAKELGISRNTVAKYCKGGRLSRPSCQVSNPHFKWGVFGTPPGFCTDTCL